MERTNCRIVKPNAAGWVATKGELIVIYGVRCYDGLFMPFHEAQNTVAAEYVVVHHRCSLLFVAQFGRLQSRADLTNTVHIKSCDRVLTLSTNYTNINTVTRQTPSPPCQWDNVDVIGSPGPEALLRCVCNLLLLKIPDLISIEREAHMMSGTVLTHQSVYHALDLHDAY
jgi:hypothetical protein